MRIRITALPRSGEFEEFDLRRFRVGDLYDVPSGLGSLLIIAGYAQLAPEQRVIRAEAADFGQIRIPKPKQR